MEGALHPHFKSVNISNAALQRRCIRRHFSYSKVAQYLMHSTEECATSRRVSIIHAKAFIVVRGSDALFPNDFGRTYSKKCHWSVTIFDIY